MNIEESAISNILSDLLKLTENDSELALKMLAGFVSSNKREISRIARICEVTLQTSQTLRKRQLEIQYQDAVPA
jgi:hypothetical protein